MKRKIYFLLLVSLLLVVSLFGYNLNVSMAAELKSLTISTGALGGSWYPIGAAIAELVNPKISVYGYHLTSVPGGGKANPVKVGMGESDMGFSQPTNLKLAVRGELHYDEAYPKLRGIANLFDMAYHFLVAEDSKVESIKQLIESKQPLNICPGNPGSSNEWMFNLIMEAYGTSKETLEDWGWKLDYGSHSHAISLYRDRHIDGFTMHTAVPNASATEAINARAGKLLSIDQDIIEKLVEKWGMKSVTIPSGSYPKQDQKIDSVTMSVAFFSTLDVPEEVIYEITKALYENVEYMQNVHVAFKQFNPEFGSKGLAIELHPGAKKYYEEIGILN